MDDLISRQDAIDAMTNTLWHYPNECYRNLNEYEFAKGLAELGLKSVPSVQPERNGWAHIDDIYRLISGHSNYHGDNILAALTCLAEGKEVLKPIMVLDAQPERRMGKWTEDSACEFCGFQPWYEGDIHTLSYCPNCGADMRGGNDEQR